MQATDRMEAVGQQQSEMLQVSLAPALVALGEAQHGRRTFFVTALKIVREANFPTRASHQSRFDEIVAQNLAPQRSVAGQNRQVAMLHKGADAENGIVTPIVAVALRPESKSFQEDGTIHPRGELLHP